MSQQLCPNKEICGSCSWSHIPYEKQLEQKLSDINGSFKIKGLDLTCDEIIPAPKTAHYRNRMDFVINFQGLVGMREKGKWWKVIDNHTCFISDELIEKHFKDVRDWTHTAGLTFFDRKAHEGLLRYAVIRTTKTGESMIIIVTSEPKDAEEETLARKALENLAEKSEATTLIWSINHTITDVSFGDELHEISGQGYIEENINGNIYRITPNAFFQTNSIGAEVLQTVVREMANDISEKTVLDLYCGSGFFSIDMAKDAKKTIGVELVPEAIHDAKVNAELNNVEVKYHDAKTEEFDWQNINPDLLILDPPRSGMHDKALADVIAAAPKEIIYVSCNYKNFAREMVQLEKLYNVEEIKAVDMFPHTPHVELVTKLVLK